MSSTERAVRAEALRRFKPYPTHKNSGVEWLGEVPTHWHTAKMWRVCRAISGGTPSKEQPEYWGGEIPWVSPKDMKRRLIQSAEDMITERALAETGIKLIAPPVVLIVVRGMILAHTFPVAITTAPVTINQDMKALRLETSIEPPFMAWLFEGVGKGILGAVVEEAAHGTRVIRMDVWRSLVMLVPPTQEQRAIAAFLDRETAPIDALVAKKERLIELLQEQRTALISRAVTRGLDPDVAMKESGVEWLGEIPAGWEVVRLKEIVTGIEQGWSPLCENRQADEGEWGVLKVGCVNGEEFDEAEHKALPTELQPVVNYEIRSGDILMSRANTRELLGSAVLVRTVRARLLLCDKLYRIRVSRERVLPEFVVRAVASEVARFQLEREATGASASMQNVSQETIANLLCPLPAEGEQRAIAAFLDQETARIDALVAKVHEAIERLKEHRTALISAAVTGKIDVREEVA